MVYGRNGSRPAIHVESRCNSTNFDCGAGYYHGYIASVLYSVSNHVAGVPGMLACLQEYHMCGENQAVKYRPFASIHVSY